MNIEIRADGVNITGYVNVTEKKSRPVMTPHGKVIEEIEPRAFERALERAGEIGVTVDHDNTHIYAYTKDGTLVLYEDNIGLHADVLITDPDVIEMAKQGKIVGWSFTMYNVKDTVEARADELPLRKITELDIMEVSLIVNKCPAYSATSVEVRANAEVDIETRTFEDKPKITEIKTEVKEFDNTAYTERIKKLKT